jgi:predicted PurR-regulated permease PerM
VVRPNVEHPGLTKPEVGRQFSRQFESRLMLALLRFVIVAVLIYWGALLLRPFLSVALWTAVLAVSLYPLHRWLTFRLGGRSRLAAALVTVLSLLVLTIPAAWLALLVGDVVRSAYDKIEAGSFTLLSPPAWIRTWPVIGEKAYELWELARDNFGEVLVTLTPQLKTVASGLVRIGADAGLAAVSFLAAIVIAGFLLPGATVVVGNLRAAVQKIDPSNGGRYLEVAAITIRAVARGVVGISALQAIFASIGFNLAGLSQASILTFAVFIFAVIQIGAAIVIIPVIIWGWMAMSTSAALLFTVYMLFVATLDNILKPFVMGHGLKTPTLAILIGVVGGAISYGISGVFLGPIVVSVIWVLLTDWIRQPGAATKPL